MNKKSGLSFAVLLFCMTGIILVGRYELVKDTWSNTKDNNQSVALEKKLTTYSAVKDYVGQPVLSADTYADDNNEITQNENLSDTEDQVKQEEQEEIDQDTRQEEVAESLKIENPKIKVSAKAAILRDAVTGEILYHKNALKEIQPASTAKLLTAIVAVGLSDEDEEFQVGKEIRLIAPDSSRAYLSKGEVLSLGQILDALLLPSGNDAAYVIAANLGRKLGEDPSLKAKDAVALFIEEMNRKAEELGAVDSNFMTPDGYDEEGQYTTAYDMALIACEAIRLKPIMNTVKKEKARDILLSGEDVTWYNSNKLIKKGSGYYYEYAIGLKTGTSGEAGRCLISAAKKKKRKYVSVVMNASYEGRWQDSLDLLKYGVEG